MTLSAAKLCLVLAGIAIASPASAAGYYLSFTFNYVGKPPLSATDQQYQLQRDTYSCDVAVGVQSNAMSAGYRACMMQRGWRYASATKEPNPPASASDDDQDLRNFEASMEAERQLDEQIRGEDPNLEPGCGGTC